MTAVMKARLFAGTCPPCVLAFVLFRPPVAYAADHAECSHLVTLKLPDLKVTEAVGVPAAATGPIRVAHCRVTGVIEKEIRFSLLLPDPVNPKFMLVGR